MRFYEVHDQGGCLIKTRNIRTAKASALAFMRMRRDRMVHIDVYALKASVPSSRLKLDPAALTWSDQRLRSAPAFPSLSETCSMPLDAGAI